MFIIFILYLVMPSSLPSPHTTYAVHFCRWMSLVTAAVLYNSFMIIVRETFDQLQNGVVPLWIVLDYASDLIYLTDVLVQFFTSKSSHIYFLL